MSQVTLDLSRYQHLPLDAFKRAQLVSFVLFPKWCYRALFIPHDRTFYDIDQKARNFVTAAKGIEPRHKWCPKYLKTGARILILFPSHVMDVHLWRGAQR